MNNPSQNNHIKSSTIRIPIENNTKVLFEYTQSLLNQRRKDIDTTNSKLATFLAFSGVLLKFSNDLFGEIVTGTVTNNLPCYSCSLSKFLAICFAIYAIISCSQGLLSEKAGHTVSPKKLKEKYFLSPTKEGEFYIINNWIAITIPELERTIEKKQKYLKRSIRLIMASSVFFGLNIIIKLI
jgi:hypothetical protein